MMSAMGISRRHAGWVGLGGGVGLGCVGIWSAANSHLPFVVIETGLLVILYRQTNPQRLTRQRLKIGQATAIVGNGNPNAIAPVQPGGRGRGNRFFLQTGQDFKVERVERRPCRRG